MSSRRAFVPVFALVVAAALAVTGCAGVSGTIRRNAEATQQFENGEILPGHTYYWSGVEQEPDGILAITDGITLETRLWNRFEPGNGKLKEMVGRMRQKGKYVSQFPYGAILKTDDGRYVGVWFSEVEWTVIRMRGDNAVEITTPGKIKQDQETMRKGAFGK